jgi:hypothetical protein
MKTSRFWIAVLGAGLVMNAFDFVVHGQLLNGMYYAKMPSLFNSTANPAWYILGDFLSVLVLAWFYDMVSGSFPTGAAGGAKFGAYAGILISFPTWLLTSAMIIGFPYGLAWLWTILGVAWGAIAGAVVAALYKKSAA